MNSVIITDYGVALGKTGDRLVVRGPRPRLELIEGGPQLFLPLGLNNNKPKLTVVSSSGPKTPPPPLRMTKNTGTAAGATGAKPLKLRPDQIEMPLFRVGEIIIGSPGISVSADLIEACCGAASASLFSPAAASPSRCSLRRCWAPPLPSGTSTSPPFLRGVVTACPRSSPIIARFYSDPHAPDQRVGSSATPCAHGLSQRAASKVASFRRWRRARLTRWASVTSLLLVTAGNDPARVPSRTNRCPRIRTIASSAAIASSKRAPKAGLRLTLRKPISLTGRKLRTAEPSARSDVVGMRLPSTGDQKVHIEQMTHASSSRSALTVSVVIGGAAGAETRTGRPNLPRISLAPHGDCAPRSISVLQASPRPRRPAADSKLFGIGPG